MLPPCFILLPTATPEKDFLHLKDVVAEDGAVKTLRGVEKGVGLNANEFQKYCGKKHCLPIKKYDGTESYDLQVDLNNDEFLSSLGKEKKKKFDIKMKTDWEKRVKMKKDRWYMIVQDGGKNKVGLYQDYAVFKSIRKVDGSNWELKGVWFPDLAAAQNYIQVARDEEGVHWSWPQEIPVWWKTGPFTQNEIEDFLKVAGSIEVTVWPRLQVQNL